MATGKDKTLAEGLTQIASVLKSNGIDGELVLGFRNFDPDDINLKEPVFIIFDGLPVPFFIDSLTKRGNSKILVHLTDIHTYNDAEELVGKAVYIKGLTDTDKSIEDFGFETLVGWTVLTQCPFTDTDDESETQYYDESDDDVEDDDIENDTEDDDIEDDIDEDIDDGNIDLEEIGTIVEYYDIPGNPCIEVETKSGTVMIPLHEDLILSVDPEYKELIMTIPEGLLD